MNRVFLRISHLPEDLVKIVNKTQDLSTPNVPEAKSLLKLLQNKDNNKN
jgi:hydroxymethylpyrimidine/phosphomethylpyrimidine kinase